MNNSTDWGDVGVATPSSCCAQVSMNGACTDLYTQGCLTVMEDIFVDNFGYIAGLRKL